MTVRRRLFLPLKDERTPSQKISSAPENRLFDEYLAPQLRNKLYFGRSWREIALDKTGFQWYNTSCDLRECWNWQTGTFEVRVPLAYGFKSRLAHQI